MKAVILAGGRGTRIAEESALRPKPMVEIGGIPIILHIMRIYAAHGINEFILCLGYKGHMIKEYFSNYRRHQSDVTLDLAKGTTTYHRTDVESWKVTLIDTGEATQTGGRLLRVAPYLKDEENFCLTYGDGVGDIDITALLAFHAKERRVATVTAVRPSARFGALKLEGSRVTKFAEKPMNGEDYINGGFFVLSRDVLRYIQDDNTVFERTPLEKLAQEGQLSAYHHNGFWQPMDTLRDKETLEQIWASSNAPWKIKK